MYLLALAALLQIGTIPPQIVSPHATLDECLAAASKRNHEDSDLQTSKGREIGAAYVCLKLVYPT